MTMNCPAPYLVATLLLHVVLYLSTSMVAGQSSTCDVEADPCEYTNDGLCDVPLYCSSGDCADCDPLHEFDFDCPRCIENSGTYCQFFDDLLGFDVGVCMDPGFAAAYPSTCEEFDGSPFVTECGDEFPPLPQASFVSCTDPEFLRFDPCFYQANGYCEAGGSCRANEDCVDCDPLQTYEKSCDMCVKNGGLYCFRGDEPGGFCNSPEIAEAFPLTCIRTNGTAYNDTCPPPFTCSDGDFSNDPCVWFSQDGYCDASGENCPFDSDCIDCDPLQEFKLSCDLCIENGGVYCFRGDDDDIGGFCNSPKNAAAAPFACLEKNGTAYNDTCPPPFSCSNGDFSDDPCGRLSQSGYCDADGQVCPFDSDCIDCDPLQEFRLSCDLCIENGGLYCFRGEEIGGFCNSPENATAAPFACLETNGTAYMDTCPPPFSCANGDFSDDPCGRYTGDGYCDADGNTCPFDSDCFDCDPLQEFRLSCDLCVENGGLYCFRNDAPGGFCNSPEIAEAFPLACIQGGGTAYNATTCPPPFSCSDGTANDPCFPYTQDGYCHAGDSCAVGSDCVDCDPLMEHRYLGCDACVREGGVFCKNGYGEPFCNSPEIAEGFPTACSDTGGTEYSTVCEPVTCDASADSCSFALDGVCDVGPFICDFGSDCFDCSPCMQLRFDGCDACTSAGCVWCGSEALCVSPDMIDDMNFTAPLFSCSADDFAETCPSTDGTRVNATLYDSMEWVYDLINVKAVWDSGITGAGVGVRINDDGVDAFQPNFISSFDESSSCGNFLPHNNTPFHSHGTTCAALVASKGECSIGIAPEASISSCRIINEEGGYDEEVIKGFHYLYENQEGVDISSNSYGNDTCFSAVSRRELQSSACPFVKDNTNTPCSFESQCAGENWSSELSPRCEYEIAVYCSNPLNYERDSACVSYLDLFVRCQYNAQSLEERSALIKGVTEGRQGKGIIYVFSAGNEHGIGEDVNSEGALNSRFTISVGSVGRDGKHSSYSTTGAALSVSAPGGDIDHYSNIMTTTAGGGCRDAGSGTSWAGPLLAGVVALVLEVNPKLTWRDVQGVLAVSSQMTEEDDPSWTVNGGGLHHSYRYGFGIVDAHAAVTAAKDWSLYGPEVQVLAESGSIDVPIPAHLDGEVSSSVLVDAAESFVAESATIYLDLSHSSRGDLEIILTSPSGTESILHPGPRPENTQVDERWKFMTLRNWNESPSGEWTLQVVDRRPGDLEECKSSLTYYFIANSTSSGLPFLLGCPSFSFYNLCTTEGKEGPGFPAFPFDLRNASLGLSDPIFSEQVDEDPREICCECGGGILTSLTPPVLKSWSLVVYGHEVTSGSPTTGSGVSVPASEPTFVPTPSLATTPEPSESSAGVVGMSRIKLSLLLLWNGALVVFVSFVW